MPHFDCIVAGTGGVGSSALRQLAIRGVRALGIDRFPPGHDRGSSHGDTRIIRLVYFEHPDYVPLLRRAYELWDDLEARTGDNLHERTGLLQVGPEDGEVIRGVLESARLHGLEIEELDADEITRRFPQMRVPEGSTGVFERGAGFLRVEACVHAHTQEAKRHGATLAIGETVLSWKIDGGGVRVTTDREQYSADRLIVTAGAWASDLLAELGVPLVVKRKPLFWFRCDDAAFTNAGGLPSFLFERPEGVCYGFPVIDGDGLKIAEHDHGDIVDDPLTVDRSLHEDDRERVVDFLSSAFPTVSHEVTKHAVCFYTMSPDLQFIVDRHPEREQVVFAAGLSGHGFKFTSVLGEILTELALDGRATLPIDFLSVNRPGLRPATS